MYNLRWSISFDILPPAMAREQYVQLSSVIGETYLLGEQLGPPGSSGTVFRASLDPTLHTGMPDTLQDVAIKMLHIANPTQTQWEEFREESRRLAGLRHPNIVSLYEYDVHEQRDTRTGGITRYPYMVMERVTDGSLRDKKPMHSTNPLLTEEVVSIVPQIADGLQYAHEHGVMHRDVKPENILLSQAGQAKITDFGLAISARIQASQSGSKNSRYGSFAYMAPEQFSGLEVNASDQYSLGVVAYELLTGKLPVYIGYTQKDVYQKAHQNNIPLPFAEARGEEFFLPDAVLALEEVVMKALAKTPHARYTRIGDFGEEMRATYSSVVGGNVHATHHDMFTPQEKIFLAGQPTDPDIHSVPTDKDKRSHEILTNTRVTTEPIPEKIIFVRTLPVKSESDDSSITTEIIMPSSPVTPKEDVIQIDTVITDAWNQEREVGGDVTLWAEQKAKNYFSTEQIIHASGLLPALGFMLDEGVSITSEDVQRQVQHFLETIFFETYAGRDGNIILANTLTEQVTAENTQKDVYKVYTILTKNEEFFEDFFCGKTVAEDFVRAVRIRIENKLQEFALPPMDVLIKKQQQEEFKNLKLSIESLFKQMSHDEALSIIWRSAEIAAKNVEILGNIGIALNELGHYTDAIPILTRALSMDKTNSALLFQKGIAYFRQGKFEAALRFINQSIQHDPTSSEAFYHKGIALYELKEEKDALEALTRSIQLNPQQIDAIYKKAHIHILLQQYQEAAHVYTQALSSNPLHASVLKEKLQEIQPQLDNLSSPQPIELPRRRRRSVRLPAGSLYRPASDEATYVRAKRIVIDNLDEPGPSRFRNSLKIADGLFTGGKYEEALRLYERELQRNPSNRIFLTKKAESLTMLQRYEESISIYDQILQKTPEDVSILYKKGESLYSSEKYREASVVFREISRLEPLNTSALHYQACIEHQLQRYEQAIQLYDQILRLHSKHTYAMSNRGLAKQQLGEYPGALYDFDRAIRIDPHNIDAWVNKGNLLELLGETEALVNTYARAFSHNPTDSRIKEQFDRVLAQQGLEFKVLYDSKQDFRKE